MDPKNMSPNGIEEYLKTAREPDRSIFLDRLVEEFEVTDNSAKRNSLALLFAEYGKEMALTPIVKMIQNQKSHKNRGTLLYALNQIDYIEQLEYLFTLVFDDNFEVKREAYMLVESAIENNADNVDKVKKNVGRVIQTIRQLQEDMDFYVSVLELISK